MTEITVKILVELLYILALITEQVKQGKTSKSVFSEVLYCLTHGIAEKFAKKFFGDKEIEAVLKRLDRLTQDEARNTAAQTLEVVYGLVQNMKVVIDGERSTKLVTHWVLRIHFLDGTASTDCLRGALGMFYRCQSTDAVSDRASEIMHQIASSLNESKRQSPFNDSRLRSLKLSRS